MMKVTLSYSERTTEAFWFSEGKKKLF
jgi:hypothetical protein